MTKATSKPAKSPSSCQRVRNPVIDLDKVTALAGQGMTQEQMASHLGMGYSTLRERIRTAPAIGAAYKKGLARGQSHVTNSLYKNAVEKQDTIACIFWLKNRANWTDKQEVSADQTKPLQVRVVSYGNSQAKVEEVSHIEVQGYSDGVPQRYDKYGKALPDPTQKGGEGSEEGES